MLVLRSPITIWLIPLSMTCGWALRVNTSTGKNTAPGRECVQSWKYTALRKQHSQPPPCLLVLLWHARHRLQLGLDFILLGCCRLLGQLCCTATRCLWCSAQVPGPRSPWRRWAQCRLSPRCHKAGDWSAASPARTHMLVLVSPPALTALRVPHLDRLAATEAASGGQAGTPCWQAQAAQRCIVGQ